MYMISDNIFFFNVLLYIFKTVQFEKILIDELGIQSGLLNQNFQKVFGDSDEHNIFCNSYMCVKKNYCCLVSLNWYIFTVFSIIFKSYGKFALILVQWIWERFTCERNMVYTVAVIATHHVSITILCWQV